MARKHPDPTTPRSIRYRQDHPGDDPLRGVWLDVGAHLGEYTFETAQTNPDLTVYAFEPNLEVAVQMFGRAANFVVIPLAVAETEGSADFYVMNFSSASSLLPFNPSGFQRWTWSRQDVAVERVVRVPTIRLDTFMDWLGIASVEFMKVDAQGADLAVVKSAGDRLRNIRRIMLEVQITPEPLYRGAGSKDDTVRFLLNLGFARADEDR